MTRYILRWLFLIISKLVFDGVLSKTVVSRFPVFKNFLPFRFPIYLQLLVIPIQLLLQYSLLYLFAPHLLFQLPPLFPYPLLIFSDLHFELDVFRLVCFVFFFGFFTMIAVPFSVFAGLEFKYLLDSFLAQIAGVPISFGELLYGILGSKLWKVQIFPPRAFFF